MKRISSALPPRPLRGVLFDLDGTLIDSRADLADAVNAALSAHGHASLDPELIVQFVGSGALNLIERSLEAAVATSSPTVVLRTFSEMYRANHRTKTTLYPGVASTLATLDRAGLRMAVVSNKPEEFTRSLLEHFDIARHLPVVLGGDSLPERKPHPAPFLQAMRSLGLLAHETIVVGDGEQDMLAARAAGIYAFGLTSGFRSEAVLVENGADALSSAVADLVGLLESPV